MYVQYHKITLFSIEDKRCFVSNIEKYCALLTGLTRLELATSAVTGRCSNQLNYKPNKFCCALIMPDHLEFCNKNKKDFYLKSWRVCHPVYNGLHLELR